MKKTLLLFLIFSGFQINANCLKTVVDEYNHAVGLKIDGTLWVWNGNSVSKFGDEINTDKNVPTLLVDSGELIATTSQINLRCAGSRDGSATITPSGGTAPYSYLWSNGKTTATITGLIAGNYTCTVTDAASSSIILSVTITQPTSLFGTVTVTNADCHSNGNITLTSSGGTPPYQYSISNNPRQSSNVFNSLAVGTYEVLVNDSNGCVVLYYVVIALNQTPPPTATAQTFNSGATVANLQATGSDIKWYNDITEGIALDLSVTLQTGKYYASQTINGCESTRTAVDVTINNLYTLIPDVNFENKLISLGIDSGVADGKVLTSSISSLTSLDVSSSSISDLTGIQDFVALTNLNCSRNQLTTLDISKNVLLTELTCSLNQLTSLDVSYNLDLSYLNCSINKLTSLDVSNNVKLLQLHCYSNQLTTLDVSKNVALDSFSCQENQLTALDVSKNVALHTFSCHQNQLTALDVSKNVALHTFSCLENQLTTLDVSQNVALTFLDCAINPLTNLNVSKNVALTELYCANNQLTSLHLSKNVALTHLYCLNNKLTSLDLSKNVALTYFYCFNNQLTSLDLSKNAALTYFDCSSNDLSNLNLKNAKNTLLTNPDLNLSGNPNLTCIQVDDAIYSNANWSSIKDNTANYSTDCTPYTLIPDLNFENVLIEQGIDSGTPDGKVLTSNIALVTTLDVTNKSISDLTGIQDFTAMTALYCTSNQLTSLDLSKNINLTYLNCGSNLLTSLNVLSNNKLSDLFCSGNQLTNLDVSNNLNLINLYCYSNLLTNLDISNNVNLTSLQCSNNSLASLNLKNGNNLALITSDLNFTTNPNLSCIQVDDENYSNLNWNSIKDAIADFSTNCNTYTFIPDINFENALIDKGFDSGTPDGKVLTPNIATIKTLDISSKSIVDLTGIEDFKGLENLFCYSNQLTTLDLSKNINLILLNCTSNQLSSLNVSKNVNLISLFCNSNQLKTLDVSNNINLKDLFCSSNRLTSLDLSKNINLYQLSCETNQISNLDVTNNINLAFLGCHDNQLTSLDLSKNLSLTNFIANSNQITSLDVSKNVNLINLSCGSNQLTSLDVFNNVNLTSLVCDSNQLTSLDLSKNAALTYFDCSSNDLSNLNLKNAKNTLLTNPDLNLSGNPNLTCIQVDDAIYSNANWSSIKDNTANFNTDCETSNLYTYIPDANFENKLISLGIDSDVADGKVLTSNVASLTSLDVSNSNISNLAGIENFTSLNKLDCGYNKLSTLNVSNSKNLNELSCRYNNLTALDISANLNLTSLDCIYNHITTLDVSSALGLKSLLCNSNQITNLDVTNNLDLDWFGCNANQLTTLDVSQNKILRYLDCGFNQLTSLDISNNLSLFYLNCYHNKLTSLDVSMLTELTTLACSESQFSSFDVSKNVKLSSLLCENINVTTLDLSKNTSLTELYCGNNEQLTTLDLSKNKKLTTFLCFNNHLTDLNIKNGTNTLLVDVDFRSNSTLTCIQVDDATYSNTNWAGAKDSTASYSTNCSPYTLIPDSNFEQKLIDLGIDTDGLNGKITVADINSITTLDLSNSNITDLSGIENFTALTILNCSNNQLISLDLSKNTNLQLLYVTSNPLVYINLKNGNNQNLVVESQTGKKMLNAQGTSFLGLTTLSCVKVDNVVYSNTNWSKIKETTTIYSETCTLGIEDSVFDKVAIYPNPTQGELHIDNIVLEKATVYDALGKLVKTATFTSGSNDNTMHLEGFPSGIYYIYLESEGANTAKKIIVE